MPNWCEGTLKVRGTKEQIEDFVLNGLEWVGFFGDDLGAVELDEWGGIKSKKASDSLYIKGTRRGFVTDYGYINLDELDEGKMHIVCMDAKFAWGITANELQEISKRHGVDLKIFGFERGMQFCQDIEIVGGEIVKDEEVKYNDYSWECPCPMLGG